MQSISNWCLLLIYHNGADNDWEEKCSYDYLSGLITTAGGGNNLHQEINARAFQCDQQTCFLYLLFLFYSLFQKKSSYSSCFCKKGHCNKQTRVSARWGFQRCRDAVRPRTSWASLFVLSSVTKKWQKANWLLSSWYNDCNLRDVMITSENLSSQFIWKITLRTPIIYIHCLNTSCKKCPLYCEIDNI